MGHRLISTLCTLGVMTFLTLGTFIGGDRPELKALTCTDLLNMPLEDLMEVRIISHSNNLPPGQTPNTPRWPLLLDALWNDRIQVPLLCPSTSA